jgi:threonine/homoserine/homoserine lactone efflux protein
MFREAFFVSALNPKAPALYLALVPQVIDPSGPTKVQFAILLVTHLVIATVNGLGWLLFSSSLRPYLHSHATLSFVNRSAAGCLLATSVVALNLNRGIG